MFLPGCCAQSLGGRETATLSDTMTVRSNSNNSVIILINQCGISFNSKTVYFTQKLVNNVNTALNMKSSTY